jgi:hypothetical protein
LKTRTRQPCGVRALSRLLAATALLFVISLWPRNAAAYPWFIRDGYTHCVQCHADPSGSGLLTAYGRAQGELLLRTIYPFEKPAEEPGRIANFLFGIPTPDALLLGGSIRNGYLAYRIPGSGATPATTSTQFLWMQEDLHGQIQLGRVRLNGSLGFLPDPLYAGPAELTRWSKDNIVMRDVFLGVDLGEDNEVLLRAGRINLPYGLRGNEHTMFIHTALRDDTNTDQQYGVAVAYNHGGLRTEAMAYIGNLQITPSTYWEHGVTGYLEYALAEKLTLGFSALAAESAVDLYTGISLVRQGYGGFSRWSPFRSLVVMTEIDGLVESQNHQLWKAGYAGMIQADVMPFQGFHLIATGEAENDPTQAPSASVQGAWLGFDWFFLPHADIRVDAILHVGDQPSESLLGQLHLYL